MSKFKIGDLVYCPQLSLNILKVKKNTAKDYYQLYIEKGSQRIYFCESGVIGILSKVTPVIHATQENYESLSRLYPNVEFEKPPVSKTPKEIIKAMFDSGKWFLVNYRGYGKLDNPPKNKTVTKEQFEKLDMNNYFNKNAYVNVEVFCPNTGKTIIDFVDGEVVLES